jgi:hypothetical protein
LERRKQGLSKQSVSSQDITAEVDAMLSGGAASASSVAVACDTLAQVCHELRIVNQAIVRQRQIVQHEQIAASEEIKKQMLPEYRKVVQKTAAILAALREVAVQEYTIRDGLRSSGVSLTNEFILPFSDAGEPASDGMRQDIIARWEKEARAVRMI